MKTVVFKVGKNEVYQEVAKTTSYTGAKMDNDEDAYDRIFTTDEDRTMLERFWSESKNMIAGSLKKLLGSEREENDEYILELEVSNSFDDNLKESMQRSLFSFFVMNITSKWYIFTNKNEAEGYATSAATDMEDVMRKAYYKKKPVRPTYD